MPDVLKRIVAGNEIAVSRLIKDIDDGNPEATEILQQLYPYTGNAFVIGVTGSPGVGKSTIVNQMIKYLRKKQKSVGVLAVDPTSSFSGGAVLGDRVRMQKHATDNGVYIRSMATRGCIGGLTQSISGAIDILDAMGKDFIILETVGVGQDEVEVARCAHITIVVVIPGMGDGIQTIKAGILEIGDIFLINKAEREGVEKAFCDLKMMIDLDQRRIKMVNGTIPIIKMEAIHGKGVNELMASIENHQNFTKNCNMDARIKLRKERVQYKLTELVKKRIVDYIFKQLTESNEFDKAINSVMEGKIDLYSACDKLAFPILNQFK